MTQELASLSSATVPGLRASAESRSARTTDKCSDKDRVARRGDEAARSLPFASV